MKCVGKILGIGAATALLMGVAAHLLMSFVAWQWPFDGFGQSERFLAAVGFCVGTVAALYID